jgi:hypothetical protein
MINSPELLSAGVCSLASRLQGASSLTLFSRLCSDWLPYAASGLPLPFLLLQWGSWLQDRASSVQLWASLHLQVLEADPSLGFTSHGEREN